MIKLPQPFYFQRIFIFPQQTFTAFTKHGFSPGVLFRDAEQSAGLQDCQSRCGISPDFRFNACMTALNVMRWESRRIAQSETSHGCSVASVKIRNFNEYLLKRFCDMSAPDFSSIKSPDEYRQIINLGAVAA
jgi:hypothetical protein